MNRGMHCKLIEYIDLDPMWTQCGHPERIQSGNGVVLKLSATNHGDHEEFWVVEVVHDRETRRFNPRGLQCIKWQPDPTDAPR